MSDDLHGRVTRRDTIFWGMGFMVGIMLGLGLGLLLAIVT